MALCPDGGTFPAILSAFPTGIGNIGQNKAAPALRALSQDQARSLRKRQQPQGKGKPPPELGMLVQERWKMNAN